MKKQTYIKPLAEAVAIEMHQILAGSETTIEVKQDNLDSDEDKYVWAE